MSNCTPLVALFLALSVHHAHGAGIPVSLTDPSFEATATSLLPGVSAQSTTFRGWFMDGTANANARVQPVNPGTFWGEIVNRDGDKAAFAAQVNTDASGAEVDNLGYSLYQTVELQGGQPYELTVGVGTSPRLGNANTSGPFKNDGKFAIAVVQYPVTRAANTPIDPLTVVGETTGIVFHQTGSFTDYTLSFTPAVTGLYNIALQNRGYVMGTGPDPITGVPLKQSTIFFDNVRLSQVPEPAAIALVSAASVVGLLRRRRP